MSALLHIRYAELTRLAYRHGLVVHGVSPLDCISGEEERLRQWQDRGFHGEMKYMAREAHLFSNAQQLLPAARSIVSFGARYENRQPPPCPTDFGRVARYAWGRDYHKVLQRKLKRLVNDLAHDSKQSIEFRVCSDAVPLLERAVARSTEAGFIGKSTMFIVPGRGSFFFLAELLWNVEVGGLPPRVIQKGSCGSCERCQEMCPTNAIVAPFSVDARRCIAYLTIEKRGNLALDERPLLGNWLFGCDVCQEVCPFNHKSTITAPQISEFEESRGVGPILRLTEVLSLRSHDAFLRRFAGTPLMRAKREGLLRNAACVARNMGAESAVAALEEAALGDPAPTVRRTAIWARAAFEGGRKFAERGLLDEDQEVRAEVEAVLAGE